MQRSGTERQPQKRLSFWAFAPHPLFYRSVFPLYSLFPLIAVLSLSFFLRSPHGFYQMQMSAVALAPPA